MKINHSNRRFFATLALTVLAGVGCRSGVQGKCADESDCQQGLACLKGQCASFCSTVCDLCSVLAAMTDDKQQELQAHAERDCPTVHCNERCVAEDWEGAPESAPAILHSAGNEIRMLFRVLRRLEKR